MNLLINLSEACASSKNLNIFMDTLKTGLFEMQVTTETATHHIHTSHTLMVFLTTQL